MASTTLSTIRQRVCQSLGIYRGFTTTGAGESDKSTLVCTSLDYPDDALVDKWVKITSGSYLDTRRIRNNYYTEGIIRPYVLFSGQIATSVTFEIYDFDPDNIINYINEAIRDAYPQFSNQIVNSESLVGGNVLPTATFDEWASSSYPDYTTLVTATASKETTNIKFATYALKLGTAAGSCYYSSDSWRPLFGLAGQTPYYYRWVKTAAASNARIYIATVTAAGTTTTTYSDYHTGAGEWELLDVSASIPQVNRPSETTDIAEIRIGCATATTTDAYFCKGHVRGDIEEYLVPSAIDQVREVYSCNDWYDFETKERARLEYELRDKAGVKYIWLKNAQDDKKIELKGLAPYTALTADASTIDLDTNWQRVIEFGTMVNLLRAQATPLSSRIISEPLKLSELYQREFENLKRTHDKRRGGYIKKWG